MPKGNKKGKTQQDPVVKVKKKKKKGQVAAARHHADLQSEEVHLQSLPNAGTSHLNFFGSGHMLGSDDHPETADSGVTNSGVTTTDGSGRGLAENISVGQFAAKICWKIC